MLKRREQDRAGPSNLHGDGSAVDRDTANTAVLPLQGGGCFDSQASNAKGFPNQAPTPTYPASSQTMSSDGSSTTFSKEFSAQTSQLPNETNRRPKILQHMQKRRVSSSSFSAATPSSQRHHDGQESSSVQASNHAGVGSEDLSTSFHQPILATQTSRMNTAKKISEISREQLNFAHLRLVGRETEQRIIRKELAAIAGQRIHNGASDPDIHRKSAMRDASNTERDERNGQSKHNRLDVSSEETVTQDISKPRSPVCSFVSVTGLPGVGKSALVQSALRSEHHNMFIASCKSDLKQVEEPFLGIKSSMTELCSQIVKLPKTAQIESRCKIGYFEDLQRKIVDGMDYKELQVLSKVMPNLVDVVGADALLTPSFSPSEHAQSIRQLNAVASNQAENTTGHKLHRQPSMASQSPAASALEGYAEQSNQLKFALQHFLQIVTGYCPLVLVLDDIQWADKATLDTVESWLLDTSISSFMFIASYRSNLVEESDTDIVHQLLKSIEKSKRERCIRNVKITVVDLTLDDICTMLAQLLGCYDDGHDHSTSVRGDVSRTHACRELADIVHKRTGGNAFFVQQFIRLLVEDDLLTYNIGRIKWEWDNDKIRRDSPATINIVQLMEIKMQRIDGSKHLLPVAACLGSTFSWFLLRLTMHGFVKDKESRGLYERIFGFPPPITEEEWSDILSVYKQEGLIEILRHDHGAQFDDDSVQMDSGLSQQASIAMPQEFVFVHDKVQEAALALIGDGMLPELQFRIGRILMEGISNDELDQYAFVVVNLMNRRLDLLEPYQGTAADDEESFASPPSPSTSADANAARSAGESDSMPRSNTPSKVRDREGHSTMNATVSSERCSHVRFRAAELNRAAGHKAIKCAAFRAALTHFQTAIKLLPADHWRTQYSMSLDLFTSAAEAAYVCSDHDQMFLHANTVIDLEISIWDKIRVYNVLMKATASGSVAFTTVHDQTSIGREVLEQLGYTFPRFQVGKIFAVVRALMTLKSHADTWAPEKVALLSDADDPQEYAIVKTLSDFSSSAYVTDPMLIPLVLSFMMKRMFKNGTTPLSPVVYGGAGFVLGGVLGKWDAATAYANHAIKMAREQADRGIFARVYQLVYPLILQTSRPLEWCKEPLPFGYAAGMSAGAPQVAVGCMYFYLEMSWYCGNNLDTLEADLSTHTKIAHDFKQDRLRTLLSIIWQTVLNLQGASSRRTVLVGDAFNEYTAMQEYEDTDNKYMVVTVQRQKIFVSVFIGEYEVAADLALVCFGVHDKHVRGQVGCIQLAVFCANACYIAVSRRRRSSAVRKKYYRVATRAHKMVKQWTRKGNPNLPHQLAMLEAEKCVAKSKRGTIPASQHEKIVNHYEQAIRLAGRSGRTHDQALANERMGSIWLRQGDRDRAKSNLDEALRLYDNWGAHAKVAELTAWCGEIWKPPLEIAVPLATGESNG